MLFSHPFDGAGPGITCYGSVLGSAGGQGLELGATRMGRNPIAMALYATPAYDLKFPPLAFSRLMINLTASAVSGGVSGERARNFVAHRYSMFLTPAGTSTCWTKAAPSRHIGIFFQAPPVPNDDGEKLCHQLQGVGSAFNFSLPGSGPAIDQLAAEITQDRAFSVEAAKSLAWHLLVQLARRLDSSRPRALSTPWMQELNAFVDAHLSERILVADMAALVGLSGNAFAHAFSRHTGRSPHQFVLSRRVEQAARLLRGSTSGLAEVAAACGFSSQQHMTRVLKQRFGMTPAKLREAALSERHLALVAA